jgi:hypothetical protein
MIKDLFYLRILGIYHMHLLGRYLRLFLVYVDTHQVRLPLYKYGHTSNLCRLQLYGLEKNTDSFTIFRSGQKSTNRFKLNNLNQEMVKRVSRRVIGLSFIHFQF